MINEILTEAHNEDLKTARLALLTQLRKKLEMMKKKIPDSIQITDDVMANLIKGMYVREQGYNKAIDELTSYLKELE